ncbi:hypothetical protein [Sulfurovum sp.]|uniref:hypothetical protein n=1 Tax=Sulfurovum sp. TaxID=1969726 RepID=UPI00356AA328
MKPKLGLVSKVASVALAASVVSTQAAAAVTWDGATSSFVGTIETAPFTSAVVAVIGLIGLVVAVKAGLRALKSA